VRDRDKLAAIGEMAAGLAHEIKNPLGAISGAAQLLRESREASPSDHEFLGIILDETRRLSGVVSDFLDYAKPRRNQPQMSCDPIRVIEHTASLAVRDARISWELRAESEGLALEADPEILKQCLLNLFLNATQAMEGRDRPFLRVSVRELRPRKIFSSSDALPWQKVLEGWDVLKGAPSVPYIEIEVEDNGRGIADVDLPRIFEPFYTTKARGTGLGLAITKRLVEEMGGTIAVRSRFGAGTTFTLHLPVRREIGPLPQAGIGTLGIGS
jgi:signal transduction histidine kinase